MILQRRWTVSCVTALAWQHRVLVGRVFVERGEEPLPGLSDRMNQNVERVTRIELAFSAWEADVLPLNYTRRERHRR